MVATTECRVLYRPETSELRFLPEGPCSLGDGRFSWVAIQHGATSTTGSLNIYDASQGTNQTWALPGRPGFAFPTVKPDVFVVGAERRVGLFDTADGSWKDLCTDVDANVHNTIINDGVVFEDNLIFGCKELEFKTKKAGLYLYRGNDKALIRLRDDQICSNGKAVLNSSNGELILIDIDSPSKTITGCRLDIASGSCGDQTTVVDLTSEGVFPDGMIVTPDAKSLIVALYDPGDPEFGAARQYSLATGQLEAVWTCPGSPRVTCPQLVRINGKVQLVLTTAVEHMEPEQQAKHPNAGCLFVGDCDFDEIGDQPVFNLRLSVRI